MNIAIGRNILCRLDVELKKLNGFGKAKIPRETMKPNVKMNKYKMRQEMKSNKKKCGILYRCDGTKKFV